MIKVENKVNIYELNGERTQGYNETLIVRSDSIWNDRVVLVYGELRMTVTRADLLAAIANATNTGGR